MPTPETILEQIPLEVTDVANQVPRTGVNGEFAALQVGESNVDFQTTRAPAKDVQRDGGTVDCSYLPAARCEIHCVPPRPTSKIQCAPGRQTFHGLNHER